MYSPGGREGRGVKDREKGREWIEELPPLSSSPLSLPFLPSTGEGKRIGGEVGETETGERRGKGGHGMYARNPPREAHLHYPLNCLKQFGQTTFHYMNVVYRKQFPKHIKECLDSCPKPGLKCLCKWGLGIGELVKTGRGESLGE